MPGAVMGKHMSIGYAGKITRDADVIAENRVIDSGSPDIYFGEPVELLSTNKYKRFSATGTAATFAGVAVMAVKQSISYVAPNTVSNIAGEKLDVIVSGTVAIHNTLGTPVAGGAVYVRIAVDTPHAAGLIGDFTAQEVIWEDGGGEGVDITCTVKLDNVKWTTGYVDANGNSEATITYRVNP
jgi:hypothetical protein